MSATGGSLPMRSLPVLAALLLGVTALAGCFEDPQGPGALSEDRLTGEAGTGSLAGIVVDDAVRPLADANVSATGPSGSMQAVSDAEGRFRFDDLAAGVYVVVVGKTFYIPQQQAVTVVEGVEPEPTRFQLTFEASQVPYANVYKLEGYFECGTNLLRICANINIATWIVVCGQTGGAVCPGNVTTDRTVLLQWVEPGLDFVQAELAWSPTTPSAEKMGLIIGGASEAELQSGFAPGYNFTEGASPLMLRLSNHESPDSWCHQQTDNCEDMGEQVLNRSGIGTERALLAQVDAGPTFDSPLPPNPVCDSIAGNCSLGAAANQPFTLFTIAFYGYEPPIDWLFSASGEVPPPPA